jgi:hypothetical protein
MSVKNSLNWMLEDIEKLIKGDIDPCREVFQTLEEYAQSIQHYLDRLSDQDSQIPSSNPGAGEIEYPPVESHWIHTNGEEYEVICYTNTATTLPEKYPITVIYSGRNGKIWSRPLADWHRSMTPVPPSKG